MYFSLEVLPARKGDCLLLHFGKDVPHLMMIDGGPSGVYKPQLKPRLASLRAARGLDEGVPLTADVLLVSHIDDDHIRGILDLTKELGTAKREKKPLFLKALALWHNNFDAITGATHATPQEPAKFGAASLAQEIPDDETLEPDAAMVLASVPQGFQLRTDADFLNWAVNPQFGGGLIMATDGPSTVTLRNALKLTVIGPMQPELERLRGQYAAWLEKRRKREAVEPELAAYIDVSIPNLSSVVLLAEMEGRRALLTGDARGDKILEGLVLAGVLEREGSMHVDLLKVPHHGSAHDMEIGFFRQVVADHYVFSGDGEHGNPERETIEMLLDARGGGDFTIHFTYALADIDEKRREDWNKERRKEERQHGRVRPEWNPEAHGLVALFRARGLPNSKQRIRVVETDTPHLIDLLDTVTW
jgi:hypothetical protein